VSVHLETGAFELFEIVSTPSNPPFHVEDFENRATRPGAAPGTAWCPGSSSIGRIVHAAGGGEPRTTTARIFSSVARYPLPLAHRRFARTTPLSAV
jgi:hypothetical protein